jgi:hypothetical protein
MICERIIELFILIEFNINFPIFACKTLIKIKNIKLPEYLSESVGISAFILFIDRGIEGFDSLERGVLFHNWRDIK